MPRTLVALTLLLCVANANANGNSNANGNTISRRIENPSCNYADDKRDPTVGAAGSIDQIILPGTELAGKPIDVKSPIVARVVNVFPHGDSHRYDIQFHGLEPGKYDLSKWLIRKDGSSADDLPTIEIEIRSLLPPGQIEPNPLRRGWLPRLGGYRIVAIAAAALWFAVLLGLILLGRKKPQPAAESMRATTLAELLEPRLQAAIDGRLNPTQHAELERMLFAYWRQRLKLERETPTAALAKIHAHADSGPLMKQLEQWMHNPSADRAIDLAQLLRPYRSLPADNAGFGT